MLTIIRYRQLTKLIKILSDGNNGTIGTLNESLTSEDGCLAKTQIIRSMAAITTTDATIYRGKSGVIISGLSKRAHNTIERMPKLLKGSFKYNFQRNKTRLTKEDNSQF